MFEFSAKRRKIISSFFCLSLSIVLMVSCVAPVITTLVMIHRQASLVVAVVSVTERLLVVTASLVNTSYQILGDNIQRNDPPNEASPQPANELISKMEVQHSEMSAKQQELAASLRKTKTESNNLFSMLENRANENSTPELKREQLFNISNSKKTFDAKIDIADDVSSKLKVSIKKYDDILGDLQISAGLGKIREYTKTVDDIITQTAALNKDVQIALAEGRQIIGKFEESSSPTSSGTAATTPPEALAPPTAPSSTDPAPTTVDRPWLGVEMMTLTPELRQEVEANKDAKISIDLDEGVFVNKIVENSPADKAGIKPGDVIVAIDRRAVTTPDRVIAKIDKSQVGDQLSLIVRRDRQNFDVVVRLSVHP
jgi:hypothetical protein